MAKKKDVFEAPRSQVRAIRRHEIRDTFKVMHAKEKMYSDAKYATAANPFSSFYAGLDPRRKCEAAAAGMVS